MSDRNEAGQRFRGFVHMAAAERGFISRAEEKRLLEAGMERFGLDANESRGVLLSVVDEHDFVLERELDRRIATLLERDAGKSRRIDRKRFNEAAKFYAKMSRGGVSEGQARRNVKRVMEDQNIRPARSGLLASRRWYRRVDRQERQTADAI